MTLTLTPEQERRLTDYAKQKQKPIPAALDDLLPEMSAETAETPKPQTGAELLAYWEKNDVLG